VVSNMLTKVSDVASAEWQTVEPLEDCRRMLHNSPFLIRHSLANHPLFTVGALATAADEAAKRKDDVYWDAGDLSLTDKWGSTSKPQMTISEVIDRIETAGAWLVMKHLEIDPRYKVVLDEFDAFFREIAGSDGSKLLSNPEMLAFVTSPNRKTPYHFDSEVNVLVQIHGTKDVWVCPPHDRTVTTEDELERYYAVDITAGTFKPAAEKTAQKFTLQPGDALHIPTHGAHWVQNHNDVSVGLSLNLEFPRSKYADIYRANYYLRRAGFHPQPFGSSAIADRCKAATFGALRQARSLIGK
jgi:hypothetical protein